MAELKSVEATAASNVATRGAAERTQSGRRTLPGSFVDTITLDVSADWNSTDGTDYALFGPIPAGAELLKAEVTGITSATDPLHSTTPDLGDDVDVGWRYMDGSNSDHDAFAVARNLSTPLLATVLCAGRCAPPTNDRDWFLVLDPDSVTGAADGTFSVTMTIATASQ